MTERFELLKLSAQAAGIKVEHRPPYSGSGEGEYYVVDTRHSDWWEVWNPFDNSEQAFRLLVVLGLRIEFDIPKDIGAKVRVQSRYSNEAEKNYGTSHTWHKEFLFGSLEDVNNFKHECTAHAARLAIVKAAASCAIE